MSGSDDSISRQLRATQPRDPSEQTRTPNVVSYVRDWDARGFFPAKQRKSFPFLATAPLSLVAITTNISSRQLTKENKMTNNQSISHLRLFFKLCPTRDQNPKTLITTFMFMLRGGATVPIISLVQIKFALKLGNYLTFKNEVDSVWFDLRKC